MSAKKEKAVLKVTYDEETKLYNFDFVQLDGLDELNIASFVLEHFRERISTEQGRIVAEEMCYHAYRGHTFFYDENGEVVIKTTRKAKK